MRDPGSSIGGRRRRSGPRPFRHLVLVLDYREPGNVLVDLKPVTLKPKAWKFLLRLAQEPGTVVPYRTMYDEVWGDAIVEMNQLSYQKSAIRKAFAAVAPERGEIIQTFPKAGFMLDLTPREVLIIPPQAMGI